MCPKRQSRQTVRFHATQPDFILEGPQRIILDVAKLDPWRFEEFNVLPCRAHYICSENSAPHCNSFQMENALLVFILKVWNGSKLNL